VKNQLITRYLTMIITEFTLNKKRRCCDNEFEQTLALMHGDWSREAKPVGKRNRTRTKDVNVVIGKTWFLDEEFSELEGGYVRLQKKSVTWKEQLGETQIVTTEGLTT